MNQIESRCFGNNHRWLKCPARLLDQDRKNITLEVQRLKTCNQKWCCSRLFNNWLNDKKSTMTLPKKRCALRGSSSNWPNSMQKGYQLEIWLESTLLMRLAYWLYGLPLVAFLLMVFVSSEWLFESSLLNFLSGLIAMGFCWMLSSKVLKTDLCQNIQIHPKDDMPFSIKS